MTARERRTVGYIVQCLQGGAMTAGKDGVLHISSGRYPVTLFKSKADARRSIRASLALARSEGYSWHEDEYSIARVTR